MQPRRSSSSGRTSSWCCNVQDPTVRDSPSDQLIISGHVECLEKKVLWPDSQSTLAVLNLYRQYFTLYFRVRLYLSLEMCGLWCRVISLSNSIAAQEIQEELREHRREKRSRVMSDGPSANRLNPTTRGAGRSKGKRCGGQATEGGRIGPRGQAASTRAKCAARPPRQSQPPSSQRELPVQRSPRRGPHRCCPHCRCPAPPLCGA